MVLKIEKNSSKLLGGKISFLRCFVTIDIFYAAGRILLKFEFLQKFSREESQRLHKDWGGLTWTQMSYEIVIKEAFWDQNHFIQFQRAVKGFFPVFRRLILANDKFRTFWGNKRLYIENCFVSSKKTAGQTLMRKTLLL